MISIRTRQSKKNLRDVVSAVEYPFNNTALLCTEDSIASLETSQNAQHASVLFSPPGHVRACCVFWYRLHVFDKTFPKLRFLCGLLLPPRVHLTEPRLTWFGSTCQPRSLHTDAFINMYNKPPGPAPPVCARHAPG